MIETIRENARQLAMVFGIVAFIGLIGVLVSRDDQPEEIVVTGATTTLPSAFNPLFSLPGDGPYANVSPSFFYWRIFGG